MTTSLYIHWPFCESKCPYCDFNSHVRERVDHDRWLTAYLKEIEYYSKKGQETRKQRIGSEIIPGPSSFNSHPKQKVSSIFFGGGTPSLMKPEMVVEILAKVKKEFIVEDNIEITLEANPSSYETEKFKAFKQAGINRVSIGVQTFDENMLKFLGRKHDKNQAINAIESARKIFDSFSFDLIYATPEQTVNGWDKELDFALGFNSPHISLYQLTIEKGTPFYSDFNNKKFELPEEEVQTELYELTVNKCAEKGLNRYEISNFAKAGFESRHNLNYWLYNEYIGIGPGAHGRILEARDQRQVIGEVDSGNSKELKRVATMNIHHPENWLDMVEKNGHGLQTKEILYDKDILGELIFMGLRIKDGIKLSKFEDMNLKFEELFDKKLVQKLVDEEMMMIDDKSVRLTDKGLLLHTNIVRKLLS